MHHRPFGNTSLNVSEIGHGTWTMGGMWGPRNDRSAINALVKGIELGITFIDTAAVYGHGHSESLIASAFKEAKQKVSVATKIPPKNFQWPAQHNIPLEETFPKKHIIELTEFSLKNLRTDCITLQQLHVWSDQWLEQGDELFETISLLKKQGKINYFGISINDHEPNSALEVVSSGLIDSVQVIYNIFDQEPANKLFPLCQKHGVAVIVRVPLDEGSLTGNITRETSFHKKDWRSRYFTKERLEETCQHVDQLRKDTQHLGKPLSHIALQFCLAHPAVSTVIPGMRTIDNVEKNCVVSGDALLKEVDLEKIKKHCWKRNFYS
ncbi:aldo/keto reductase [bacterium]|nr:aldo/keto reductase [bacterium]MBU1916742.1 aldo/keto reductase [bacterium]